jgi:tetratricopeptide (TPR) repeat protein
MKSITNGIQQTWKALRGKGRTRFGLGVCLAILMLPFTVPSLAATAPVQRLSEKEAVLGEAKGLIDRNHTNASNLRQAISILEGYKPQFANEIRFPLYLAEAYYRLADPSNDAAREIPYYEKSASYVQQVLAMDPDRAEGHYWQGLLLLKQAQKRGISALFIVKEGIRELEKVRSQLPAYDHAGASRVLGLIYCLAPGWTPFGNLDKAIELEEEATRLAPDYALNRLYLANAYKKRGDTAAAIREYQAILSASSKMPDKQSGDLSNQARTMLRALANST